MKGYIKSKAFHTPFEFEYTTNPSSSQNNARLRVWFGRNKENWKEESSFLEKTELIEIVKTLEEADEFRIDNLPEFYDQEEEINGRQQLYMASYKYYTEKFLPIEAKFFK